MSFGRYILSLLLFSFFAFNSINSSAQCCAGGSGCPIAGGSSQGVLDENQIELNTNIQLINTNNFYTGSKRDTAKYFDSYTSHYEYFRLAYGVSKNLTMSIESGYYFQKKEVGLRQNPATTYQSGGVGDLIFFPRYDILNKYNGKTKKEITLGLGFKIPLGSYNDSSKNIEPFSGATYYVTKPQSVQLSSGAQDIIFHLFLFHGWVKQNFKVFANALYIKKGWNPIGEKLGNYGSVSLFATKSFLDHYGVTLQMRYEQVAKMQLNHDILLYHYPNYDPEATGYRKVFITPMVNYSRGKFSFYAMTDIPVYQYVIKTQIGSQHLTTFGVSFRFYAREDVAKKLKGTGKYYCPMHPKVISDKPGSCPDCKMDLIQAK